MDAQEIGREGVDWIYLANDRDSWRAVVSLAVSFRFREMRGSF
jgi:hypothetical protein